MGAVGQAGSLLGKGVGVVSGKARSQRGRKGAVGWGKAGKVKGEDKRSPAIKLPSCQRGPPLACLNRGCKGKNWGKVSPPGSSQQGWGHHSVESQPSVCLAVWDMSRPMPFGSQITS